MATWKKIITSGSSAELSALSLDTGLANSQLANSSVNFGGITLNLGGSDATPAFNLSDATDYPTSALDGTITNAQLAGSIANGKLANDGITIAGADTSLGGTITSATILNDGKAIVSGSFTAVSSSLESRLTAAEANDGDITGVTAGNGLTGGGSTGAVTLTVGAGTGVTVNSGDVAIGQAVATSDSPTFTNLTLSGDLTVNGTTTTVATTNTLVQDQFMFLGTGSAGTNKDIGIMVQSGSTDLSGSALYHDTDSERWSVAKNLGSNETAVTPLQFVGTVQTSTSPPSSTNGEYGVGEMWVETDTQDIYIRTA